MEFLTEYGLFIAKIITVVIAILLVVAGVAAIGQRNKDQEKGEIQVRKLNDVYKIMADTLKHSVFDQEQLKAQLKQEKKAQKKAAKEKQKLQESDDSSSKKRVYVINFDGDLRASAVDPLKEEITTILSLARTHDEVVVRLESPGGVVNGYGLAASQLARVRARNVPLTVSVDKVAASGGYMMACVADKIIAAPFAILGSIGVVAQLPNFHRFLKEHKIDFELFTAGEYKRTVTLFGENTDKGRTKLQQDIEDIHVLFKQFVLSHREQLDIDFVASGETWFGSQALEHKLIDDIKTSDDYLMELQQDADIFEVSFVLKKTLAERLGVASVNILDSVLYRWFERLYKDRFYS